MEGTRPPVSLSSHPMPCLKRGVCSQTNIWLCGAGFVQSLLVPSQGHLRMVITPWTEIQGGSCTLKLIFPNPATRTYSITSSLPHHSGKDILKTKGEIRLLDTSREGGEGVAIPLLYPLQVGQGTQHVSHGAALPTPGCPQPHWCVTGDQQLCTGGSFPSPPTHFRGENT